MGWPKNSGSSRRIGYDGGSVGKVMRPAGTGEKTSRGELLYFCDTTVGKSEEASAKAGQVHRYCGMGYFRMT